MYRPDAGGGYIEKKYEPERPSEEIIFKDKTIWEEEPVPEELMKVIKDNPAVQEAILLVREKCKVSDIKHIIRTAKLMLMVLDSEEMGNYISSADRQMLLEAALGHDVGKAFVPQEILHKEEKPTDEEKKIIDSHIEEGENFFRTRGYDALAEITVRHHQMKGKRRVGERRKVNVPTKDEKRIGQNGERRTDKPDYDRLARLLSIVDIFESMGNPEREYAKNKSAQELLAAKEKELGQFDSPEELRMISILEGMDPNSLRQRVKEEIQGSTAFYSVG
ncbi:MAG: HD domain-containing protein [Parcubacteria group bacterium]